jgi:hypothetical protein
MSGQELDITAFYLQHKGGSPLCPAFAQLARQSAFNISSLAGKWG